jgi:hypothetical protein
MSRCYTAKVRGPLLVILATFFSVFLLFKLFFDSGGGSHKITDPKAIAALEAFSIACAVRQMIDEKELPKNRDTTSITRALHGDNPEHSQYMYLDWPRPGTSDKILDPSGQPYLIEITDHTITVKSSTYGVHSSLDY